MNSKNIISTNYNHNKENSVILHILSSNSYSGAENVAISIINNMKKKLPNTKFIYASPIGSIQERLIENDIVYAPIEKMNMHNIKKLIQTYSPHIVHAHDFRASFFSSLLKKNYKLIIHIHNNTPFIRKRCLKSLIFLYSIKKADKVLTVSNSIEKEYVYKKSFKDKLYMIGNPVNLNSIRKQSSAFAVAENYDIIFLGRLSEPKNPLKFLNLIAILKESFPDIKVAMIGDGELRNIVSEQISKLGLNSNVFLLGFLNNPFPYLKNAKLMLMPSLWEGFGLVAVEALSLGVPVVSSNAGGLPDIITDKCGKVCIEDNDYINEITQLLTNSNYLSNKKNEALKRAIELENNGKYYDNITELYKNQ